MSYPNHHYPAEMHPPMLPAVAHRILWQQNRSGFSDDCRLHIPPPNAFRERQPSSGAEAATLTSTLRRASLDSRDTSRTSRTRSSSSLAVRDLPKEETRRKNHILSEQKRRLDINHHLAKLRQLVPQAAANDSKATTLTHAINHIERCHQLLADLGYDISVMPEHLESQLTLRSNPSLRQQYQTTVMVESDSEPPTPSSVESLSFSQFFESTAIATSKSVSETEESSDAEPIGKRRLSVRDLCS